MATTRSDSASYLRGKAHMAGIGPSTPLRLACDVLLTIEVDGVPGDQVKQWRKAIDRQLLVRPAAAGRPAGPDRETWGLAPEQMAATSKLTAGSRGLAEVAARARTQPS